MNFSLKIAIAVGIAASPITVSAQTVAQTYSKGWEVRNMIRSYDLLNEVCRGSSGDNPSSGAACNARLAIVVSLNSIGWCNGKRNQSAPEMKWHKCTANSLRANE
jgi:hypothetical protein